MCHRQHSKKSRIRHRDDPEKAVTLVLANRTNPLRIRDDATADELWAEVMKHLGILMNAGAIDPKALPVLNGGIANQPFFDLDQSGINGE
jgi:hypothetical protein